MQGAEDKNIEYDENILMTPKKIGISDQQRKRSEDIHGLRAYGLLYRVRLHGIETQISWQEIIRHLPAASDK